MSPPRVCVAWDLDGTIVPGDREQIARVCRYVHGLGGVVFLNTARRQEYCDTPHAQTLEFVRAEHHLCRCRNSISESKVANMRHIHTLTGTPAALIMLVDDVSKNVDAVRRAGYAGVLVDSRFGVESRDADRILDYFTRQMSRHARNRVRLSTLCIGGVAFVAWRLRCA